MIQIVHEAINNIDHFLSDRFVRDNQSVESSGYNRSKLSLNRK